MLNKKICSSFEIFEYLLLHGGDPLIENINKEEDFDSLNQYSCYIN